MFFIHSYENIVLKRLLNYPCFEQIQIANTLFEQSSRRLKYESSTRTEEKGYDWTKREEIKILLKDCFDF